MEAVEDDKSWADVAPSGEEAVDRPGDIAFTPLHDNSDKDTLHDNDKSDKYVASSGEEDVDWPEDIAFASLHDNSDKDTLHDGQLRVDNEKLDTFPSSLHESNADENGSDKDSGYKDTARLEVASVCTRFRDHRNLEACITAPWRRKKRFDMTVLDLPDDCQREDLEPPGHFSFTTEPGFGIRNLLHEVEDLHEEDNLHDNFMHDEEGSEEGGKNQSSPDCFEKPEDDSRHPIHEDLALAEDSARISQVHDLHDKEQGFIFMMAPSGHGNLIECTDLITVQLLAKMAVSWASDAAIKNRIERSSFLWKERAHEERKKLSETTARLTEMAKIKEQLLQNTALGIEDIYFTLGVDRTTDELLAEDLFKIIEDICDRCQHLRQRTDAMIEIEGWNEDLLQVNTSLREELSQNEGIIANLKELNGRLLRQVHEPKIARQTQDYFGALIVSLQAPGFESAWAADEKAFQSKVDEISENLGSPGKI